MEVVTKAINAGKINCVGYCPGNPERCEVITADYDHFNTFHNDALKKCEDLVNRTLESINKNVHIPRTSDSYLKFTNYDGSWYFVYVPGIFYTEPFNMKIVGVEYWSFTISVNGVRLSVTTDNEKSIRKMYDDMVKIWSWSFGITEIKGEKHNFVMKMYPSEVDAVNS